MRRYPGTLLAGRIVENGGVLGPADTQCGFDAARWEPREARRFFGAAPHWWADLTDDIDPAVLADVLPQTNALREAAARVPDLIGVNGIETDLAVAVHDGWHALAEIAAAVRAGRSRMTGVVAQVSTSGGGVPKGAVEADRIGWRGLGTDRQNDRSNHGNPWQAVCLWSLEVIEALRAEGHPIGPGWAGDNLTVADVDWARMRPGLRVRVGDAAMLETTSWSVPCSKNARWFAGGDFRRILHQTHPGSSRIYALVVAEGDVRAGDPVVVA